MRIEPASSDVTSFALGTLPGQHDEVALAAFIADGAFKQLSPAPISKN